MSTFLQFCAALGGLTFIATPITAVALWRKSKAEAKKINVDAASVLTDSALKVLTSVDRRAEKLGLQLEETQDELRAVRSHLIVLEGLMRAHDVPVPPFVWPPQRNGVG